MLFLVFGAVAQEEDTMFVKVSTKGNYYQDGDVTEGGGSATVTVSSQEKQKWHGFAGTFNEAGWDALLLLSESERDRAIRLLFDKEDGIGFPWGRIPIGSSDYGLDEYTFDDIASGNDYEMEHFSIDRDKNFLIKYIQAALAVKPDIKFWASPWTVPSWMKEPGSAADAAGWHGGNFRNEAQVMDAHALYFSKFIEEYGKEGITINAVCPQNEPGYTQYYPSCGWGKTRLPDGNADPNNGNEYLSDFIKDHLGPKLASDHPATEIWMGTLSNDAYAQDYWNGARQKAGDIVKGLGLQWNCDFLVKGAADAGYFVFNSEHQCGNYPWYTPPDHPYATSREDANRNNFLRDMAPNNHAYGEESWDLIKHWIDEGVNLYSAWNMVLDEKGLNLDKSREWPQNALLAVNRQSKTLEVTPYYYVMRHIGQYVDSGAVRLETQGGDALAFKNPSGSIVTAISNTGGSTQMTVSVGGKNYQFNHPGQGWATLYVGPKPVWTVKEAASKYLSIGNGLKVVKRANGYLVSLPSREAGRIELLTVNGRVLESRAIPRGKQEIMLPRDASNGMLIVRAVYGGETATARVLNAR